MKFDKYIDIPYKHLGKSFNGADCYGLLWLIYKNERDITLPDNITYKEFWYKDKEEDHLIHNTNNYIYKIEVNYPYEIFDALLFYNQSRNFVDHIGIYTESDHFLHTYRNNISKIHKLNEYWISRIWKVYRWKFNG